MTCVPLKEALEGLEEPYRRYAKRFANRLGLNSDDPVELVYAELPGWNEDGEGYLPIPCCWKKEYCR